MHEISIMILVITMHRHRTACPAYRFHIDSSTIRFNTTGHVLILFSLIFHCCHWIFGHKNLCRTILNNNNIWYKFWIMICMLLVPVFRKSGFVSLCACVCVLHKPNSTGEHSECQKWTEWKKNANDITLRGFWSMERTHTVSGVQQIHRKTSNWKTVIVLHFPQHWIVHIHRELKQIWRMMAKFQITAQRHRSSSGNRHLSSCVID